MNKRGLGTLAFAFIFVLVLSSVALAADNVTSTATTGTAGTDVNANIDNAYKCLDDLVTGKNLSLTEATFGALALGAKGNLASRIESEKDPASCWPKGACKIKETAQVALAYNRMGKDTSAVKKWLYTKNATASELKWLLEIDITSKVAADCTVNDGSKDNKIKILENSKIQGSPGSCFVIDGNGYMLRVNANCLGRDFTISCNQDFVTSVLYQRSSGGTLFVLPETHSAAGLGQTKERAIGECFRTDKTCDYEGTLWAALALQKIGEDISRFTPYLLALADDNGRTFPSAFLYILVGGDDQYNLIVSQQKQGKFWEMIGTRYSRYYDTSLALLSIGENGGTEITAAREYLSSIQTKEGCWNNNNIRDTAFVLYAGWPRGVVSAGDVHGPTLCEPTFSCEKTFDCTNAGGKIEYDYECPNIGTSCCSVRLQGQTCEQKKGLLCPIGTQCNGRAESAVDGTCCFQGSCIPVETAQDSCTIAGGICGAQCASGEVESTTESCTNSGDVCCVQKQGSSLWFWIIFLLILIVLVVLAIVYRDKVKIWWFRFDEWVKVKLGKKPVVQPTAPGMQQRPGAPFAPFTRAILQPIQQQPQQRAQIRPVAKDKEMEEALRKLREMSKK